MKPTGTVMGLTIAALMSSGATVQAAGPPAGFAMYTMSLLHASIAYPRAWIPVWQRGHQFFYGKRSHGFTSNVNIYTVTTPRGMTLSGFATLVKKADTGIGARVRSTSSGSVGPYGAVLINGILTQRVGNTTIRDKFTTAAFLARGRTWEITLSSDPAVYTADLALFKKMLPTFRTTA